MNKADAFEQLETGNVRQRLEGARYLSQFADQEDLEDLRRALDRENTTWIQLALEKAIIRASSGAIPSNDFEPSTTDETVLDDVFSQAVQETAGKIVHEIAPGLGILETYASQEIQDYEASRTKGEIDRLNRLLEAIEKLGRAAEPARLIECNIGEVVERAVGLETPEGFSVLAAGPTNLEALADPSLIQLVLSNALRNAIEATTEVDGRDLADIIVAWGQTDVDYWISVLDGGIGLPDRHSAMYDVGITTKDTHLGMGLAIADQAARSLRGAISIQRRDDGPGTRFELRWPKQDVE